jgi:hypothetical protein
VVISYNLEQRLDRSFHAKLTLHRLFRFDTESIRIKEVLRRLLIDLSELDQFEYFDAALTGLAFREKRMRPSHPRRDFPLRQVCLLPCHNQFFEKSVIESLVMRRPPLAGDSRLRLLLFLHLPSVVNA